MYTAVTVYIQFTLWEMLYARNVHFQWRCPMSFLAMLFCPSSIKLFLPARLYLVVIIITHWDAEFDARGEKNGCHRFASITSVCSAFLRCDVVEVKNET